MTRAEMWNNVPPFYREPVILCADEHRSKGLLPRQNFGFSAENTAVPLGLAEFAMAVRHYPIVFAPGALPIPLAVTGLVTGGNLLVDPDGAWKSGAYVPGYLRRYPFILGPEIAGGNAPLLVDAASGRIVDVGPKDQAIRLFHEDGSPTTLIEEAASLCLSAHREQAVTAEFAEALRESGILTQGNAQIRLLDGSSQTVQGFSTVDARAYRALPDSLVRRWFAAEWLDAITLHLVSLQNWSTLAELYIQRRASQLS